MLSGERKGGDHNMDQQGKRNKVVARFRNGTSLKGYTHDFTPMKESFHMTCEGEAVRVVQVADCKAIFFVKSLEGDKDYSEKKRFDEINSSSLRGLKIKIEFYDGEIIRGVSLGYNKTRKGFYIIPLDPGCNNERIYVVAASVKDVKLGSQAEK